MNSIHTIARWFLQASIVQLFLTLISLPILIGWGLPISYLTPIGTLLFTPMLTVYLWSALLVFFTTLLHIPNDLCIKLLTLVSTWWLWTLSLIKKPIALGFVCPPLPLLCIIPITSFALIIYLRKKQIWIITCALASLLFFWVGILKILPGEDQVAVMHNNSKTITAFIHHNKVTVVDTESSCSSITDAASWLLYTVIPTITKKTGATQIDRFIILHPRQRTFEALTNLCTKGIIADVYIPYWQGHIPFSAFCAYRTLKKTLAEYGHHLYILKTKVPFILTKQHTLSITTTQKKYGDATYPLFMLNNNSMITQ